MHRVPSPSAEERYCAWYADAREGVLYFGTAAFWWALHEAGDPLGDLRRAGPQLVGRFDLDGERFLPFLATGAQASRSGTWDVLAHPNGRVYFTTFFEAAGFVDPGGGEARLFPQAGPGLNELALLPDGNLLASRYAPASGGNGSVVVLDPEGRMVSEWVLASDEGWRVAPKSVAFDPLRREIWVTTDLLPRNGGADAHDARVLDATTGRELRRIERPEVQFVRFAADGSGQLAEQDGRELALRTRPAGDPGPLERAERVVLDPTFPAQSDFVQDLQPTPGGGLLVTRWSGRIHRVERDASVRTVVLPRPGGEGLYYTAVSADGRLCATYCAGVGVVCGSVP